MKKINYIFIILLTTICCFSSCDNTTKEPNTYEFERRYGSQEYDLPIIKVKLGDKTVNFIVDSGSEANIISEDYYKSNKNYFEVVGTTDYILSTMDTETPMKGKFVQTILDDSVKVTFTTMESINNMLANVATKQGIAIKGILGVKFLYDNNVVIDFANKKVITNFKEDAAI